MGRLTTWTEVGTAKSPAASNTNSYDANGDIRRTQTSYRMLDANGAAAASATAADYWFAYDSMNRLVIDKGQLSGTAMQRVRVGVEPGQRISEGGGDPRVQQRMRMVIQIDWTQT
jgi:hypothetical protein